MFKTFLVKLPRKCSRPGIWTRNLAAKLTAETSSSGGEVKVTRVYNCCLVKTCFSLVSRSKNNQNKSSDCNDRLLFRPQYVSRSRSIFAPNNLLITEKLFRPRCLEFVGFNNILITGSFKSSSEHWSRCAALRRLSCSTSTSRYSSRTLLYVG